MSFADILFILLVAGVIYGLVSLVGPARQQSKDDTKSENKPE